jgi:hypothetical protein
LIKDYLIKNLFGRLLFHSGLQNILGNCILNKWRFKVTIEDHGDGIMIRPAMKSLFQAKMEEAEKNKKAIYSEMKKQAAQPEIQDFYEQEAGDWGDIDTEIID